MNKTLWIDTLRLIKKTLGRFFLLICIVALGVSFFVGVKSTSSIMAYNIDKYNDEYKLMDFTIYSPYGFDDKDIKKLKTLEYISYVEDTDFVDALCTIEDQTLVLRVHAISDNINDFKLLEGRLPIYDNECVIERSIFYFKNLKVGDLIKLDRPDNDLNDFLATNTYKVVGFVLTPYYLNQDIGYSTLNNRSLNTFIYVNKNTFITDYYSELSLTFKRDLNVNSFSENYKNESKYLKEKLEEFGKTQIYNRREKVLDEAYEEYNDGLKEYEDGLNTFNEEIADAKKKIEDGKVEIKDGEKEIKDGYKELADKEKEVEAELIKGARDIEDARNDLGVKHAQYIQAVEDFKVKKTELESSIVQIDGGISQIDGGISQAQSNIDPLKGAISMIDANIAGLNAQISSLDPNDPNYANTKQFLEEQVNNLINQKNGYQGQLDALLATIQGLENQKNDLLSKKKQIQDGISSGEVMLGEAGGLIDHGFMEITNASVKLDESRVEAQEEFEKARKDLKQAEIDLVKAKVELADGIEELEKEMLDGQQELDDAKADLDKAKQDIEELEDGEWAVISRDEHYASKTFSDTISQMDAIGNVFPLFFFLVASLVCLTTMNRMIDEQRGQIGIYRALGYSKYNVYFKYIFYALLSTLIGGFIGSILGLIVFPRVIYQAWNLMYNLPSYHPFITWDMIFIANLSFICVMVLTTYLACRSDVKEAPSQLLRPKVLNSGKSILIDKIKIIWDRINFSSKLTIRNIIRYKKRFFMTILGVAGCTALIIAGLGIRDSLSTIINKQFDIIYKYNGQVKFDDDISASKSNMIYNEILKKDKTEDAILLTTYQGKVYENNREELTTIEIFNDTSHIDNFYTLRERLSHKPINLSDYGVIINEKLSELLKVKVGDTIKLESENGVIKEVIVSGITEHYVYNNVYVSSAYYKDIFGVKSNNNTVLIKSNASDSIQKYQEELVKIDGVESISFFDFIIESFNGMIEGLDSIMYVIVLAAGALAFVVLSNLTNVNISERERELATFKVLGFTQREIYMFIYKENLILTFIGTVIGIPLGKILHRYIINLVEMDFVMFGRNVNNSSILFAMALTMIFSITVNLLMAKKISNIKMVESLKSVE